MSGSSFGMGASLFASGGYTSGVSGSNDYSDIGLTASELSANHREIEQEDVEEEEAFKVM